MNKINTLLVSATGLASTEVVPATLNAIGSNVPDLIQVIVQIAIGIATLIGMFKKKKSVNP